MYAYPQFTCFYPPSLLSLLVVNDFKWLAKAGRAGGLGFTLAAFIFLGLGAGVYLDKKLGTTPIFTIGLLLTGIAAGFYTIFREVGKK